MLIFILFVTGMTRIAFAPSEAWWNSSWTYRIKLTFDNSASAENLVNFPIMVNLGGAGSDFWTHVDADYRDLRFIDDDATTELYFEIEYWNYGDQEASVWVQVPQIDAGSTTDFIYVYYGNAGATESSYHSPTQVWDSNFVMVQHLEETSGTVYDSTSHDNDGAPNGGVTQDAAGKIAGGDDFDGSDDYISISDADSLDFGTSSFSYMFWLYSRDKGTQYVFNKQDGTLGSAAKGFKMGISSDSAKCFSVALGDSSANVRIDTGAHLSWGESVWAMFAVVVDRTQDKMFVYVNGDDITKEASISSIGDVTDNLALILGRQRDVANRYFDGKLDEARISDTARSADWVKASYLSMNDEFITFSPEEEEGELILTVTSPQNTIYYTKTATVPLDGTTNLDADITYSLDGQDPVTVAENTQSFSTSLTGLTYATHSITVYAEESADPLNTASTTIDFTVEKPPSWACPNCEHRIKLTFDNSLSSGALSDFPVLVVLTPSRIDYDKTAATDIRFYDGDTLLPKETELWDEAGNSYIWVKVPQIDASATDFIYAYYDCTDTVSDDATSVWDPYVMVHHLEETSGTVTDSTSYDNDGTYSGATQDATGKIDGADEFDGVDDYIAVSHADSLNLGTGDFTISVWVKYTTNGDSDILRKGSTGTGPNNYKLELLDNKISGNLYDGGNSVVTTPGTYNDDNWHYAVFLREGTTIRLYVDGDLEASAGSAGRDVDNTANMGIGSKDTYNDDHFNGIIDEVRIIKTARSEDWIKASYLAMDDAFITYGSEETLATIESCDSDGTTKDTFNVGETVYVTGSGYAASTSYPIHVVDDVETWSDGMTIPTRVSGTATSVSSNPDGDIPATEVWSLALVGEYDIVVDFNSNGEYDAGVDALDDLDVGSAGFFVIPEYVLGTILALAMCFAGFGIYWRSRNHKQRALEAP